MAWCVTRTLLFDATAAACVSLPRVCVAVVVVLQYAGTSHHEGSGAVPPGSYRTTSCSAPSMPKRQWMARSVPTSAQYVRSCVGSASHVWFQQLHMIWSTSLVPTNFAPSSQSGLEKGNQK